MIDLPLYPKPPLALVTTTPGRSLDSGCRRCSLHSKARTVCLPADGRPGGLYAVGLYPGRDEDIAGRVNVGQSGRLLRAEIAKHWAGPVVYDNAVRCAPRGREVRDTHIAACRPYLAQTLREARPTRVLAMGGAAVQGLLGRSPPIASARRGYGWVQLPADDGSYAPIPVMFLRHPAAGLRNVFVLEEWKQDLEWALTVQDLEPPPADVPYKRIVTARDSRRACEKIRKVAPWFAYDLEWAGLPDTDYFELLCAALVPAGYDQAYVWGRTELKQSAIMEPLLELLADPNVGKVGHNVKADNNSIYAAHKLEVRGTYGDTRLWRRLLEAGIDGRLVVAAELVGMGGHKEENDRAVAVCKEAIHRERRAGGRQQQLFGYSDPAMAAAVAYPHEPPERFAYALVDREVLDRYCALDAISTRRLADTLEPQLKAKPSIHRVWSLITRRLTDAVAQMERWGIAADKDAIIAVHDYLEMELQTVTARLSRYGQFNPGSPQEVGELLFNQLKLPPAGVSEKTGKPSTAKMVLQQLRGKHPVVDDILEHRRLSKLQGTYGRNLAAHVRNSGRIYPDFKIDGTQTGRLSVGNPALHQIPRADTPEGRMIKQCFVAPPGRLMVQFDYSQIELRVAAMMATDPVMIAMFQSGEDFHEATAKLIAPVYWGIRPDQVTKKHRSAAKAFNFGLLYGMTDQGMAKRLGCSVQDATRLRQAILGKWVKLAKWIAARHNETRQTGYAWTEWGGERARARQLYGIRSHDSLQRANCENAAINTPVQGTASDYMLASICDIIDWLRDDFVPAKLVLTVHDSVIFEVEESAYDEVAEVVPEIMLSHDTQGVPLKVDVEVGPSWGALQAVT